MESNRDRDRPHSHPIRTLSSKTNEQQLFLCLTSRLSSSSSSMKISKSILSPGRSAREISLSSSLSRRLKTNGSLKGAQSPMFPSTTTRKKAGAGFENPEPSSPKVTCIGQVRVKSKKKKTSHHNQHSTIRSRSQRSRSADYSFRRFDASGAAAEDGNNGLKRQSSTSYRNREIELDSSQRHGHGHTSQKWVRIPVTICESLRSFGADFNCFLPCRSDEEQQQQLLQEAGKQGCGSVLARWHVAVQDGEKGGGQIELVVGGRDDEELCGRRSYRKRHVMEDIDIKEIEKDLKERVGRDEIAESGRRVSICVPPKNALLLMRCGSDPVKMAALANRFWEPPPEKEEGIHEIVEQQMVLVKEEEDVGGAYEECETEQAVTALVSESDEQVTRDLVVSETEESVLLEFEMPEMKCEGENSGDKSVPEEMYEDVLEEKLSVDMEHAAVTGIEDSSMEIPIDHQVTDEEAKQEFREDEMTDLVQQQEEAADHLVTSPSSEQEEERRDIILTEQSKLVVDYGEEEVTEEEEESAAKEIQDDTGPAEKEKENSTLPDCLLLMMCQPKLSMEVSQETWVCTADFVRWLQPRELNKTKTTKKKNDGGGAAGDELLPKRVSIHYEPPTAPPQKAQENRQFIPPRSSCSYPAPPAKHESACEPMYNLTRCKSEPRRAAAKLAAAGMGF